MSNDVYRLLIKIREIVLNGILFLLLLVNICLGQILFTNSGQELGNNNSISVALGDIDNDGDLEAFVANNGPNKVWLNQTPALRK